MPATPLALKNLLHDRRRLVVAVGGIGFAVLLMFIQIGFQNALLDSTVQVIEDLNADLVIVSRAQYALPAGQRFARERLLQARAIEGVASAYPLYIETFTSVLKHAGSKGNPIRVLAWELDDPVFENASLASQASRLKEPGTALIDRKSKAKFGIPNAYPWPADGSLELSDRAVKLVGAFSLGTDFANDGNLAMSANNFVRYFPQRAGPGDPRGMVDLGIVRGESGANLASVRERLLAALPEDVDVYTKREFVAKERKFWSDSTPVGYIFTAGTILGFLVGVIICYQIIFGEISDHLGEFATLKSMGYPTRYFVLLVLKQALYLSLLGFVPGVLASFALYQLLAASTGLLMMLTLPRILLVLALAVSMCIFSGLLAMRRLINADPAELF